MRNDARSPLQPFGRRVRDRRTALGLTQHQLSSRVAMSRAALSHLEAGITVASERSVCLLAGVFDLEPHDLVAGTDYPIGKAERLPLFVARHGHVDLTLAVLQCDLTWCDRLEDSAVTSRVINDWLVRLVDDASNTLDPGERSRLSDSRTELLRRLPK
jgi:transcriptional regulator with XRE-family HTH domain